MSLRDELAVLAAGAPSRLGQATLQRFERMIADLADQQIEASALGRGEMAPDFTLTTATGERLILMDQLRHGPVLLIFYRGSWCPYCDLQLRALGRMKPEFQAAGTAVLAVAPSPATSEAQLTLGFPLLTDYGNRVARLFGLVWEIPEDIAAFYRSRNLDFPYLNGTNGWELPVPAAYVIRPDGNVHFVQIDSDYRRRPEPTVLLATAREAGR